jgi:uracil-DNA glycosylase
METWDDLTFWSSGEWDAVQEKLFDLEQKGVKVCPVEKSMFEAMHVTPFKDVRVVIFGQDPYPNPADACGIAFSLPPELPGPSLLPFRKMPPSLINIFKEYSDDLKLPFPTSGDLTPWCKQGVFLWNIYPTCEAWKPLSHKWPEWELLTKEIISELGKRGLVFVGMGRVAQSWMTELTSNNTVINTVHPSPRASISTERRQRPTFLGCKLFSRINAALADQALPTINWRL